MGCTPLSHGWWLSGRTTQFETTPYARNGIPRFIVRVVRYWARLPPLCLILVIPMHNRTQMVLSRRLNSMGLSEVASYTILYP